MQTIVKDRLQVVAAPIWWELQRLCGGSCSGYVLVIDENNTTLRPILQDRSLSSRIKMSSMPSVAILWLFQGIEHRDHVFCSLPAFLLNLFSLLLPWHPVPSIQSVMFFFFLMLLLINLFCKLIKNFLQYWPNYLTLYFFKHNKLSSKHQYHQIYY